MKKPPVQPGTLSSKTVETTATASQQSKQRAGNATVPTGINTMDTAAAQPPRPRLRPGAQQQLSDNSNDKLAEAVPQPNPEQQLATTASRPATKRTTRALSQRRLADIDPEHVRGYASAGLSPAEIAATLRCDQERLVRDFGTEIIQGHDQGTGLIKRKVHKLALIDEAPWALKCRYNAVFAAEKQAAWEQSCPRCQRLEQYEKKYNSLTEEQRLKRHLEAFKALLECARVSDPEINQLAGGVLNALKLLHARLVVVIAGATTTR